MELAPIIKAINHVPETTADNWTRLGRENLLDAIDGEFFRSVTENHVDVLAYDALHLLGWDMRVSPYLLAFLKRRAALNEAVYEALYEALQDLYKAVPHIVSDAMIPKGALLGPMYPSLRHRRMTDFDLVVRPEHFQELIRVLEDLGYEEEPGGFGRDLVKRLGPLWSWRDRITMHVFERNPAQERYLSESVIRDVPFREPLPELHLIALLMNAQEHAASYSFASFGSDLQYIRVIDIELLIETHGVDPLDLWKVAGDLDVRPQVALGLWVQGQLRGSLPPGWEVLEPATRAVAPFGELVALPNGEIRRWDVPARERVFHRNRTGLALRMLPDELRDDDTYLQDLRRSLFQADEPADLIVRDARKALEPVAAEIPEPTG
ncbi:nucleotidyltransferase family protein [Spirillospora sp. NBC_00431]